MAASDALATAAWRRRWPAPAKLNLFLHVVGRRDDGYHLLQTVFRLIDLADSLEFAPRDDGAIRLARPLPGVPEDSDLTVRAARLLQQAAHVRTGATIAVAKRIPLGGGLGGGSSDAATTLIALNALWGTGLARPELASLALQLGADVPFFLLGRNAFAEGIGERLTPLDLEPEVCRRYPEVARALEWLRGYGDARMSGTGSSVFAAFATEAEARTVVAGVPGEWRGVAVRGLDRHPLAPE